MRYAVAFVALLLIGAPACALSPSANPAEAIDETACLALRLQDFGKDVAIAIAAIVPRDGKIPSHCRVSGTVGASALEMRLPISPWTGRLCLGCGDAELSVGVAVAAPVARAVAEAIVHAYYNRAAKVVDEKP